MNRLEANVNENPIVAEVRRIRRELAARFDFDVKAIAEDARRRDRESGRPVVSRSQKGAKD